MGINERREREREALRTLIVEAARDLLSEQGLDALSMRAIAERIEYSPATIYLYFRDKTELIGEVVREGFTRMHEYTQREVAKAVPDGPMAEFRAMGRAYARFAIENTAYFRVMFELPGVAQMDMQCRAADEGVTATEEPGFEAVVRAVARAADRGEIAVRDTFEGAVVGWGLVHGLTSLYLGGHLGEGVQGHDQFMAVVDAAQNTLYEGWRVRDPAGGVPRREHETGTATAA
jgi:AcrR family transcriptional regulator